MGNLQAAATLAIMLMVVASMVGLTLFQVTQDPDSKITEGLIGALTLAFGGVMTHLYGKMNGNGKPPA